jgi:hypothetical protein
MNDTPPVTIPLLTICQTTPEGGMPFLNAWQGVITTPNVPAKTAYWLGRITKVFIEASNDFEKARIAAIKNHGAPVENEPGQFVVPVEKLDVFNAEIQSLDHPVELPLKVGFKLDLPPSFTPKDWIHVMSALDIFNEPV